MNASFSVDMYDPDYGTDLFGFGEEGQEGDILVDTVDQNHRGLKPPVPEYCDDFRFEWAIDGKVTSWNKDEFLAHHSNPQRVVEIVILIEDESKVNGPETEVELAYRMTGCGNDKHFKITHVYWM